MCRERLEQARMLLLTHEPWYGHAAMDLVWVADSRISTMGVCVPRAGVARCAYNPEFVGRLSVEDLYGVIQHEIEHLVRCHCLRGHGFSPPLWNLASDMAVNGSADQPRIGFWNATSGRRSLPFAEQLVWVPRGWSANRTAEEYYHELRCMARPPEAIVSFGMATVFADEEEQQQPPSLPRTHVSPLFQRKLLGDHAVWENSAPAEEVRRTVGALLEEITLRCQGDLPGHFVRKAQPEQASRVPWQLLLRQFMSPWFRKGRISHLRRARRRDYFGAPGRRRAHHPRVTVVVDVSGSIGPEELNAFFGEIEAIGRDKARVCVLLWDAAYQGFIEDYRPGGYRDLQISGGGGTDMAAPFDWLDQRGEAADGVVLLTDGFCNWPARRPYPLITVITGGGPGPNWGAVVRM